MDLELTSQMPRLAVWSGVLTASAWGFARYRAWHVRWGATDTEVAAPMPGDDLLPGVVFCATRAITIDAPPREVWPGQAQRSSAAAGVPVPTPW
jgi:hypothetical protein